MRKSPLRTVKRTACFLAAYRHGKTARNRHFALCMRPNGENFCRLGLSVSKKVGKAVMRNKIRRWVREYFRLAWQELSGVDVVVSARVPASELASGGTYADVEKSLGRLMKQLGSSQA